MMKLALIAALFALCTPVAFAEEMLISSHSSTPQEDDVFAPEDAPEEAPVEATMTDITNKGAGSEDDFPILPVAIGGGVAFLLAVVAVMVVTKGKSKKQGLVMGDLFEVLGDADAQSVNKSDSAMSPIATQQPKDFMAVDLDDNGWAKEDVKELA